MPETVAVLGAGNMGTALAQVIASNGHLVRLWSIETDVLEEIRDRRRNTKYLEGVELDDLVQAVWDLEEAVGGARLIVLSVPSQVVSSMARDLAPLVRSGQIVLNVAKGLQADTRRLSEVLTAELGDAIRSTVGSMGGPAIAIEMARGLPMAVVVAVADDKARATIQRVLQNQNLKVDTTSDVTGLELCSTLKNIYAIALGICDGLGFGANTKAFVGTVAMQEMATICSALGGQKETAYGLAGLGDLLTTGWSEHSRNRSLGEKLGADADWRRFMEEKTVEGVIGCAVIKELVAADSRPLPLLDMVHAVLFADRHAPKAMREFLRAFHYERAK